MHLLVTVARRLTWALDRATADSVRRRTISAGLPGPNTSEMGFSILEVAISLTILLTVLVSVSSLMVTAFKVGANSRSRQVATAIATSTLDAQVQTGAATLLGEVGDKALPSVTSAGQNYLAELEVTPYQPGSAGCQSPQGNGEAMLKITVWVTWADEFVRFHLVAAGFIAGHGPARRGNDARRRSGYRPQSIQRDTPRDRGQRVR